jgi:DNA-binding LacI/PurR family transcriptional regulator
MDIAAVTIPGLTTMRFPSEALGTLAAQHILARLKGEPVTTRTDLPVELVVRGSTARAPDARKIA